jgi:hypothetical protein
MTFHKSFAAATDSRVQSSTATRYNFLPGFSLFLKTSSINNYYLMRVQKRASNGNQFFDVVSKQDMLLKELKLIYQVFVTKK